MIRVGDAWRVAVAPAPEHWMEGGMDRWDGELAKAGIQMAGAAGKATGNVLVALVDGLIE